MKLLHHEPEKTSSNVIDKIASSNIMANDRPDLGKAGGHEVIPCHTPGMRGRTGQLGTLML
jgi:hypothetical protein